MEKIKLFYDSLPFNYVDDKWLFAKQIREVNPIHEYKDLHNLLLSRKLFSTSKIKNIIEFGCGTGYLSNAISYYYKKEVTGIDLSHKALDSAKAVSKILKTNVNFIRDDLNKFKNKNKFDLVVSNGVLHHNENCFLSLTNISKFVKTGGYIYLGLYHLYSRLIMLNYFKNYLHWYGERSTFNLFKMMNKVDKELGDSKTYIYSWFKDQILNVHETQHTFEEVYKWSNKNSFKIISTSINNFKTINQEDIGSIFNLEKNLKEYSYKKNIIEKTFFPGYFMVLMKKMI